MALAEFRTLHDVVSVQFLVLLASLLRPAHALVVIGLLVGSIVVELAGDVRELPLTQESFRFQFFLLLHRRLAEQLAFDLAIEEVLHWSQRVLLDWLVLRVDP